MDNPRIFWNDDRLQRISAALMFAFILSFILAFFFSDTGQGTFYGGDFPGFYVLGEIFRRGAFEHLYDPSLQQTIQNEIWPSFNGAFYMSVYPPFVAYVMYPFTFFGPHLAQIIFTLIMFGCLFKSTSLLCQTNPSLKPVKSSLFVFLLLFNPIFASIFGAQNTALTILIILLSLKHRCLSPLLLYKPQFGVPWCIYQLYKNFSKKLLLQMTFGGGLFYLSGIPFFGWRWPLIWVSIAGSFGEQNFRANLSNLVSLQSVLWWANNRFNLQSSTVILSGYIVSVILFCLILFRRRKCSQPLIHFLPLLAPQTLFYDLGITLVGTLRRAAPTDRNITIGYSVALFSWILFILKGIFYFPLFVILIPILSLNLFLG